MLQIGEGLRYITDQAKCQYCVTGQAEGLCYMLHIRQRACVTLQRGFVLCVTDQAEGLCYMLQIKQRVCAVLQIKQGVCVM